MPELEPELYCVFEGGYSEGNLVCVEIERSITVPPEEPAPGDDDPTGEITLPDGTVVDATGVLAALVGAKQIAWQSSPWPVCWIVRSDGQLTSFTYDKDEDVWAFARHPKENGAITSVQVIPAATGGEDEVWGVWQRVIGGVTRHFIERMTARIEPASTTDKSRYCYLDSAISYSGAAANSFTGADHLAGETVRGWADGVDVPEITIAGDGSFVLPDGLEAAVLHVGIHTNSTLVALPTAALRTERQNIANIVLTFQNTLGGKVGRDLSLLEGLQFRMMGAVMDDSPPLWSGDMENTLGGLNDDNGAYVVVQDTPGPMTILAAFPTYVASTG